MRSLLIIIYGVYNIISVIISLWVLLYLNMYINPNFIPSDLRWENGQLRDDMTNFMIAQFGLLTIEILLFSFLGYIINNLFISRVLKIENTKIPRLTAFGIFSTLILIAGYSILKFHSKI
ncbi:hypothetical protein [Algoriphagus aquimarinus]|uniref:Uncharacterized protein n=1 Tax=Algoriphagus aquimarinus TaxID=237018 RepID=A0A5C7AAV8_9BACT|nr:hypothetical protein [Algoriphagus aquimarinus]TXE05131.1 hypothetical protein ESV85_18110 [Algoriphagus aquimarinus]